MHHMHFIRSVRGRLGSLMMLTANAGFLLSFVAGNYLEYHQIPYIGLAISILYLLVFIFFPETPQFLLKRKKEEARVTSTMRSYQKYLFNFVFHSQLAEKSFRFYRNIALGTELTDKRKTEWELMKIMNLKSTSNTTDTQKKVDWSDLCMTWMH